MGGYLWFVFGVYALLRYPDPQLSRWWDRAYVAVLGCWVVVPKLVLAVVAERAWLGLEHYMEFGRFDRWETTRRQAHQLFVTTDFKVTEKFAVHLGLGHGLTHNSDRWAGKVILLFDF